jgi:hypothetical protein
LIPVANLPPVAVDTAAKLPPMALTPVVHLDFEKIEMILMLFSGAWGKMINEKT